MPLGWWRRGRSVNPRLKTPLGRVSHASLCSSARQLCKSASLFPAPLEKTIWVVFRCRASGSGITQIYTHLQCIQTWTHTHTHPWGPTAAEGGPMLRSWLNFSLTCSCQTCTTEAVFASYRTVCVCVCAWYRDVRGRYKAASCNQPLCGFFFFFFWGAEGGQFKLTVVRLMMQKKYLLKVDINAQTGKQTDLARVHPS